MLSCLLAIMMILCNTQDELQKLIDQLQGRWILVYAEYKGERILQQKDIGFSIKMRITPREFIIQIGNWVKGVSFQIETTKKTKVIIIRPKETTATNAIYL